MIPALDAKTVAAGQDLPPLEKGPITRDHLRAYAAASGDPNPMHTDDEFARNAGYPGVFAHGMLSMGWLGQLLVQAGGVGSIRRFRTRFAKLTWPGELITCHLAEVQIGNHQIEVRRVNPVQGLLGRGRDFAAMSHFFHEPAHEGPHEGFIIYDQNGLSMG